MKIILSEAQYARLASMKQLSEAVAELSCSSDDYDCLDRKLGNKDEIKIAGNTWLRRVDDVTIAYKYHRTDIVKVDITGTITLDTDGWWTRTTFGRMNQIIHGRIHSVKGKVMLSTGGVSYPYKDGIQILSSGDVVMPEQD
jgi:hypothetical protein